MSEVMRLYTRFERFWHWAQALLMIVLLLTGFELHGSLRLFGFAKAAAYHNLCAGLFLVLTTAAVFWHFSTGAWRQYVPTTRNIGAMLRFYLVGIFRGDPHPVHKTPQAKLNPLQKITYTSLKVVLIPFQVLTGALYYFYNSWEGRGFLGGRLDLVALLHTAGAFAFLAFLVIHLYLTTTGRTVFSNLAAMVTGREKIESHDA